MSDGLHTWPRKLPKPLVTGLATLGPIGYGPKAPGTWGSIAGLGYALLVFRDLQPEVALFINAVVIVLSIGICGVAEEILMKRDPGEVVLDEFIALPVCFIGLPLHSIPSLWAWALAGFLLFRLFDITKPGGIARLQNLPGGAGVVMDDIAAGLVTACILNVAYWGFFA